jgi:flavorubredoxin
MKYSNVTDGIFRLSAHIHDLLFEGMWPLPHGMSMNSYIVQGKEIAIIDGVCGWDGVPETLFRQFEERGLSVQDIRYVVLNHMEPDHTGWLVPLKQITRGFELVATPKALRLAKSFFGLDESFCTLHPVKSGDRIDLGKGKVLRFEEIPNVHWPETMATYEESSRTLFPCDAFGSFGAIREEAPFDDQLSESELAFFEEEAVRYFANIVAAFSGPVKKALEKIDSLDIRVLAPGHGIVWRKNPGRIVELYRRLAEWSTDPTEPEITLLWAGTEPSMGPLVKAAIDGAREEGVQIHVHKVPETHISYILSSVLRSSGVIMGIPYSSDPLPSPLAHALDDLGRKRMTGRKFFWFLQGKGLEPEGEQRSEALVEEIDRILEKYQMRWEALESAHIPRHTEEIVYQQTRALAMELLAGGAIKGHVQELVGAP